MYEMLHKLLLVAGSLEGTVIKHLGAARAFCSGSSKMVRSQDSESNSVWCSVALTSFFFFFFLPMLEMTGAIGGAHSQAPSSGRPHLPLASETTAVVYPCCLLVLQETPCCN